MTTEMITNVMEFINDICTAISKMSKEDIINNIIMIVTVVAVFLHKPRGMPREEREEPRSTWMPKTSKHPLIEMDRELQETMMLERMWNK